MADITVFPDIPGSIELADSAFSFTASVDLKRGQMVGFHGTAVDFSVIVSIGGNVPECVGVVIDDAEAGEEVAVKMFGPVVLVANGDDTTAIDAGVEVELGALGGVSEESGEAEVVGMTLEAIAGGSYGYCMLYKTMTGV